MAWLGQGAALIRMKQKKDAKLFLEQCVSLYPKSREARIAKKLLKDPRLVPATLFKV
jgi:TolA-binding protein